MRIAAFQMRSIAGNVEANFDSIANAARKAEKAGANLLVAPELALMGYGAGEAMNSLAVPVGDPLIARLDQLSADTNLIIVTGFAERDGSDVYNSAVKVDGAKPPVIYRKSHLYGDYERRLFHPAPPSTVIFESEGMKFGLLICYDVEFPENARRLSLAGAQCLVVPTALPAGSHADFIAEKMIAVRAFENQIFVAYVNHCGADELFTYAGLSHIAAPDGSGLALAESEGERLLIADLLPPDYAASAAENTYLRDLLRLS